MTVEKVTGFRAPYRGQTFRDIVHSLVGRSGLLSSDGVVSDDTVNITVPPLLFVVNGLIVNVTEEVIVPHPSLTGTFHLVAASPSFTNVDDILWTFAASPKDLTSTEIIIATWNGAEWKMAPQLLSTDGVYRYQENENINTNRVGMYSGLFTTYSSPNYATTGGTLIDKLGQYIVFEAAQDNAKVDEDPDLTRVDRILYRRPEDSRSRIGSRELVLGGTFMPTPAIVRSLNFPDTLYVPVRHKTLFTSDNKAVVLGLHYDDADGSHNISMAVANEDRTTVDLAMTDLLDLVGAEFDAVIDGDDDIHVVFIQDGDLKYAKYDLTATELVAPVSIDTQSATPEFPRAVFDFKNNLIYVVYSVVDGTAVNQVYFVSRSISGATATTPVRLSTGTDGYAEADVFLDNDLTLHVVWTNTTDHSIVYNTFDNIGDPLGSEIIVSSDTEYGASTLVDVAHAPRVVVSDNMVPFIFFLQDNGTDDGISVYTDGAAKQIDLTTPFAAITGFDVEVDPIHNGINYLISTASSERLVRILDNDIKMDIEVTATPGTAIDLARDKKGSLFLLNDGGSSVLTLGTTAATYLGAITLTGTITSPTITSSQALIPAAALSAAPVADDVMQVLSASNPGNDGYYRVTGASLISVDVVDDYYLVDFATAFDTSAAPSDSGTTVVRRTTYSSITGHKAPSETQDLAYDQRELDSDLLLARIVQPGDIVLNWIPGGSPGSFYDTLLVHGNFTIDWGLTTSGELTIGPGLKLTDMLTGKTWDVAAGGYAMSEDDALYVLFPEGSSTTTPQVVPQSQIPWAQTPGVLGSIKANEFNPLVLGTAGVGQLDDGEGGYWGEDLPEAIRERLGIISETVYENYSSTNVIDAADTYPSAISKLDDQVQQILDDEATEETQYITSTGVNTFTAASLTWDPSNATVDIQVFVNRGRAFQDQGGGTTLDFIKTGANTLQFSEDLPVPCRVTVRLERTGSSIPSNGETGVISKRIKNGHTGTIAALKTLAWKSDSTAELASASGNDSFAGIYIEETNVGQFGRAYKYGNVPGALAGLGATPGQKVYMSDTAGELTLTPPSNDIVLGYAEPADGVDGAAEDLFLNYTLP